MVVFAICQRFVYFTMKSKCHPVHLDFSHLHSSSIFACQQSLINTIGLIIFANLHNSQVSRRCPKQEQVCCGRGIGIEVKFKPLTSMFFTRQCHAIVSSHLPCLPTMKRWAWQNMQMDGTAQLSRIH